MIITKWSILNQFDEIIKLIFISETQTLIPHKRENLEDAIAVLIKTPELMIFENKMVD